MNKCVFFMLLLLPLACSKPDPIQELRQLRGKYKIEYDQTISDTSGEVTYEIRVQNLSNSKKLQELTVIVETLDKDKKVLWSKVRELDITNLGNYATKDFQFKDALEDTTVIEYFQVRLAPDDEGSDYLNYKEFMRVVP